jgi:hypothetical protein
MPRRDAFERTSSRFKKRLNGRSRSFQMCVDPSLTNHQSRRLKSRVLTREILSEPMLPDAGRGLVDAMRLAGVGFGELPLEKDRGRGSPGYGART